MSKTAKIYSTTTIDIYSDREESLKEQFEVCKNAMQENGWSWQGTDGKPLEPFEIFKLFDKICDYILK